MQDFYTDFYAAVEHSQAYHIFCELVFGRDLCQHGFADIDQLELLMQETRLDPAKCALDLGCGNGMIAEYLCDRTGAHLTGIEFIPLAVRQARERTIGKADRLAFDVGDINALALVPGSFQVIFSIDTIYFSNDYTATIRELKAALTVGGQMAILYSHGREPWVPVEEFARDSILPDRTPLAVALQANDLTFRAQDLTRQDYELAQRRKQVLLELKPQFEAEGTMFIYENRYGEATGISSAIEEGLHARYLYHVQLGDPRPETSSFDKINPG